MSDSARARVLDWHDGTLATRFNDPKRGIEVVVMQRVHERDLCGHLLERGYTHLCLPARYERTHPFIWPDDPRKEDGELLWPAHIPESAMKQIEQTMGSFRAAGQLQQRPAAAEGELLKRSWWQFFPPEYLNEDQIGGLPRFTRIVSSWDTAFEDKTSSDYVVGQIWGLRGPDRYLLWGYRRQANLHTTMQAMREAHKWVRDRWPGVPYNTLVEKSANGAEIIGLLKRELSGVIAITVSTDKITRAIAAQPALESGNIYVPGRAAPDTAAGYHAARLGRQPHRGSRHLPQRKARRPSRRLQPSNQLGPNQDNHRPRRQLVAARRNPHRPLLARTHRPDRPYPDPPIRLLTH